MSGEIRVDSRARRGLLLALLPFGLATLVGLIALWPSDMDRSTGTRNRSAAGDEVRYVEAVVESLVAFDCDQGVSGGEAAGRCVTLRTRLAEGPEAGQRVEVRLANSPATSFAEGDRVRLARVPDPHDGAPIYSFDDVVRDVPLALLAGLFAVVIVAVARWRGLAALAGLGVTYLILVGFLLPALLDGASPVLAGLVAASTILFVVLYLAHGVSARTSAALLGTLLSLAVTGVLAALSMSVTKLTGLSSDTTPVLQAAAAQVSLSGLILCGVVIGSLGVLNDVTVTQASAVWELYGATGRRDPLGLYRSGMRIGRDHIASTVYTLVLAYAGSALPTLLLFSLSGRSAHDVLTGDEIAGELVRGLVGGVGIAASVPITTAVAVLVVTAGRRYSQRQNPPRQNLPRQGSHPQVWSEGAVSAR